MVLENLEPKLVWEIFEEVVSKTPHESKKEGKIRAKIKEWVKNRAEKEKISLSVNEDAIGNILIKLPASKEMESCQPVILQAHMDMVCETDRPEGFDFDNEPIPIRIQDNGEWVDADGTTLGADNGIGVSLALATIFDNSADFKHGPLEILLTVDEETGLTGAFQLDEKKLEIQSNLLINLDSEDIGKITIGSAGGGDMLFEKNLMKSEDYSKIHEKFIELTVSGLRGGHSGGDIHLPRANANKVIARMLSAVLEKKELYLVSWNGGSKHNAITRKSSALFGIPSGQIGEVELILSSEKESLFNYYQGTSEPFEPNMSIEWKITKHQPYFSAIESNLIISTANIVPSSVIRKSPVLEDLTETSNNLSIIKTEGSKISIILSTRSALGDELDATRIAISQIGKLAGWNIIRDPSYPAWKPEPEKPFAQFFKAKYEEFLNSKVEFEAVHGGLETGVIGDKIPGIQMIAIGPTIKNPHSPEEKLNIAHVGIMYNLLKKILKELPNL
ncbi:beta-Ala-His dipeptidase [Promethearchaeum syntrophicum]|uniref:Beta-Ala-His dipeptidase n=1 Tax=Promethearchaeum syntrophicum TaxID=2594042 RepID=A0A5B9DDB3_9ARCH|nr:beta-Ala-His dipeptidase [Candidatus Prometheoarchaeum syntrophicum]QEE17112.1 peptidase T [Candidatus Prometheoarchaeum syntrophicum]